MPERSFDRRRDRRGSRTASTSRAIAVPAPACPAAEPSHAQSCPVTALYKRENGIVDFDPERCIGCKTCLNACPHDALYIDPNSHAAASCNFRAHRVELDLKPLLRGRLPRRSDHLRRHRRPRFGRSAGCSGPRLGGAKRRTPETPPRRCMCMQRIGFQWLSNGSVGVPLGNGWSVLSGFPLWRMGCRS